MMYDKYLARLTYLISFASSLIKQVLLLLCLIPACVAANSNVETVTLKLKWSHQFQFAGYYAAKEKGYYREVGLDVKIQPHGPGLKSPIDQVLSGTAQYGITDSSLVKFRLDEKPVVALAAIFQRSPHIWLVRQDSDIRGPHDLVGKRVMYLPALHTGLLAMLQVEGITASKINLIPSSFNLQDLIDGHTDAFNAYSTNEPYILREKGIPYRVISPRNYGIDFYGDVLFTSESEIDEHPERTKAFRLASLKGWKYAMDHPDEIIDLISTKYASNKNLPHLEFEAEAMRELIMPDLVTIGHINPGRWRIIAERLVTLGFAEANYNLLEGFIYDPSPKPQDLRQLYIVTASVALLALLFLGLAIWIGRLNIHLKKSEQRLREAQHIAKVGNWSWNVATGELYWSDEIYRIFGRQQGEFKPGYERFIETLHPDDVARIKHSEQEAFSKGSKHSIDHRIVLPDGSERWVHEEAVATIGEDGKPVSLAGTVQDITERKLAQERQQQLQLQLQQAQKMEAIGHLTGGIAHDFNNMLASILGFTELAKGLEVNDETSKLSNYLGEIQEAGERASELISQMLIFSRGNTDNNCLQPLDLPSLLKDAVKMLRPILPSSIEMKVDVAGELPQVMANSVNFQQVIMNLCVNARDAMDGHGHIVMGLKVLRGFHGTCTSCLKDASGYFVEFSVTDSGSGIDEQALQHIFEPFYTTKEVGKGTGMGLAVVHGIIHEHGGHIIVTSEKRKGTEFHLLLPITVHGEQQESLSKETETV